MATQKFNFGWRLALQHETNINAPTGCDSSHHSRSSRSRNLSQHAAFQHEQQFGRNVPSSSSAAGDPFKISYDPLTVGYQGGLFQLELQECRREANTGAWSTRSRRPQCKP